MNDIANFIITHDYILEMANKAYLYAYPNYYFGDYTYYTHKLIYNIYNPHLIPKNNVKIELCGDFFGIISLTASVVLIT